MPTSVVKVNDMEVSAQGSDKTVININISQESWLAFLVKSMQQGRAKPGVPASRVPASRAPAKGCFRGEQKVLGACQVLLGIVCGAIGVMFCFAPYTSEFWSGSPFWTGALLIISGVSCIMSKKRGTGCWVWLALLLTLASVVAATVAMVFWARDGRWSVSFGDSSYLCDARSPSDSSPSDSSDSWRQENCREEVKKFVSLLLGVRLLLLLTMATGLCIALYSFLHGCWALCCRMQDGAEAVGSKEPLLSSDSILLPDEGKAQDV